jgi:hypothetical protein
MDTTNCTELWAALETATKTWSAALDAFNAAPKEHGLWQAVCAAESAKVDLENRWYAMGRGQRDAALATYKAAAATREQEGR